jgi:anti-sigma B factor antagonist
MQPTLEITEQLLDGVTVVAVRGDVDVASAPSLRDRLQARVAKGETNIVVDLLEVPFLDSTALGVLIGGLKRCRDAGGDLRLVIDEPRILKVFEITGLTEVFSISPSVYEAIGA